MEVLYAIFLFNINDICNTVIFINSFAFFFYQIWLWHGITSNFYFFHFMSFMYLHLNCPMLCIYFLIYSRSNTMCRFTFYIPKETTTGEQLPHYTVPIHTLCRNKVELISLFYLKHLPAQGAGRRSSSCCSCRCSCCRSCCCGSRC